MRNNMEEIESFVRKICAEGDLRILTKKQVRTQYQACYNKAKVSPEEKECINKALETVIQELAAKAVKARKRKVSSDDEEEHTPKRRKAADSPEDNSSSSLDDSTPIKPIKKSGKKARVCSSSEDEDLLPKTKPKTKKVASAKKQSKVKAKAQSSSSEDDLPLKTRSRDQSVVSVSNTEDDATPVKSSSKKKPVDSTSDEDDFPLKSKASKHKNTDSDLDNDVEADDVVSLGESEDTDFSPGAKSAPQAQNSGDSEHGTDHSESDLEIISPRPKKRSGPNVKFTKRKIPPAQRNGTKVKESTEATSSDDDVPLKPKPPPSDSEADTSSLSEGPAEDSAESSRKSGPKIKFTKKKKTASHSPDQKKKPPSAKQTKGGAGKEDPYLSRLRVICRKAGIFVRNDTHFAGCTTDKQKIKSLKLALEKAGMEGPPSLSKVDEVNLKREAAALDTSNIIATSGRRKRQPKDVFTRSDSPKKSLSPIKNQFRGIQDLISESESD